MDCQISQKAGKFTHGVADGILLGVKQKVDIETSVVSYLANRRGRDMVVVVQQEVTQQGGSSGPARLWRISHVQRPRC